MLLLLLLSYELCLLGWLGDTIRWGPVLEVEILERWETKIILRILRGRWEGIPGVMLVGRGHGKGGSARERLRSEVALGFESGFASSISR